MERVNHIYLRKGGLILDTYQDIYGNLYYQEIRYGCKSRDRKVKEDIQYQTLFYISFYYLYFLLYLLSSNALCSLARSMPISFLNSLYPS